MRLLLDTNILIDFLARRQPYFEAISQLRIAAYFGDVELWASIQSLTDAEYILRRAIPIETLRSMLDASREFLSFVAPTAADAEEALLAEWPDLEDFLIARCAERVKADYLVTRDAKGFLKAKVPTCSADEMLAKLKELHGFEYAVVSLD